MEENMKINITVETADEKREFIKKLLEEANSKFITVEFTKVDGSNRVMNIQQASLKYHVKGEAASESAKKAVETRKKNNPNLMAVWDNTKGEIRSIDLDKTHKVRFNHIEYIFG